MLIFQTHERRNQHSKEYKAKFLYRFIFKIKSVESGLEIHWPNDKVRILLWIVYKLCIGSVIVLNLKQSIKYKARKKLKV